MKTVGRAQWDGGSGIEAVGRAQWAGGSGIEAVGRAQWEGRSGMEAVGWAQWDGGSGMEAEGRARGGGCGLAAEWDGRPILYWPSLRLLALDDHPNVVLDGLLESLPLAQRLGGRG